MRLGSLTRRELVLPELRGSDRPTVLREFAEHLAEQKVVRNADELYRRLWEREQLGSTAIGSAVAVPHCKLNGLKRVVLAVGLSRKGVEFDSKDDQPVRLLFLVVSPSDAPADHLQCLAAISKWVKANDNVERILELDDRDEILELLQREAD